MKEDYEAFSPPGLQYVGRTLTCLGLNLDLPQLAETFRRNEAPSDLCSPLVIYIAESDAPPPAATVGRGSVAVDLDIPNVRAVYHCVVHDVPNPERMRMPPHPLGQQAHDWAHS